MNMTKKFLSIILSGAMILSITSLSTSAATPERDMSFSTQQIHQLLTDTSINLNANIQTQISAETDYLRELGLLNNSTGTLTSIEILTTDVPYNGAFATIEYIIDYGQIQDSIIFNCLSDTYVDLTLYNKEDNIKDNLVLDGNQILLDGAKVEILETSSLSNTDTSVGSPPMRRVSDRVYQVACPYGTAADYNVYVGESRTKDIDFKNKLESVVYSTALSIVGQFLGFSLVLNVFTTALFSFLQESAPTSYGISCIDDKYWHKSCGTLSGGYISAYGRYVTKHVFNWYPRTNFDGIPKLTIEYEIRVIY